MADFRRFYNPGLEHTLHLEELQRSASRLKIRQTESRQKSQAMRRWLALTLTALAERIDPIDKSVASKSPEAA
ncbi:MAG: hypothetical protein AAF543_10765 [Pseudomonadota bacterium]